MKIVKNILLLSALLGSASSFGAAITNGDFANSCNLSGWTTDTDGFAGGTNDFTIEGSAPNCAASINVDYSDTDVFFAANTLYQNLDLTGALDSTFLLSMDFSVNSEITSQDAGFFADYFLIGLNDGLGNYYNGQGNLGFLLAPTDIDGATDFNLSFELDSSFANQTNWFLDFQVLLGIDDFGFTDFGGSSLAINNVSLVEQASQVPEPSTLGLFALGFIALSLRRKNALSA